MDTDKTGTRRANFVVQPCLAAGCSLSPLPPWVSRFPPRVWKVNERLPAGTSDSPRRRPARNGNPAESPLSGGGKKTGRPKSLNECNLVAPGEGKTGGQRFSNPKIPRRFGKKLALETFYVIGDEEEIHIWNISKEGCYQYTIDVIIHPRVWSGGNRWNLSRRRIVGAENRWRREEREDRNRDDSRGYVEGRVYLGGARCTMPENVHLRGIPRRDRARNYEEEMKWHTRLGLSLENDLLSPPSRLHGADPSPSIRVESRTITCDRDVPILSLSPLRRRRPLKIRPERKTCNFDNQSRERRLIFTIQRDAAFIYIYIYVSHGNWDASARDETLLLLSRELVRAGIAILSKRYEKSLSFSFRKIVEACVEREKNLDR